MIDYARLRALLDYDRDQGVFRWALSRGFKKRGTKASTTRITIEGKEYEGGRLAWFYVTGRWPGRALRYVDGDKSNIRWANLSNQPAKAVKPRRLSTCSVRMSCTDAGYQLHLVERHAAPVDLGIYSDYETAAATQRMVLDGL